MFYLRALAGPAEAGRMAAALEPGLAERLGVVVDDLADKMAAVASFADRHPEMAMAAGLEPIALEMRMILRDGALGRVGVAASRALSGYRTGGPEARDLDMVHRATELGKEACRRVVAYEAELAAAPSKKLGQWIETAFSVGSSIVWILVALA